VSATFITIPLSHYCEKARWALDRAALPYKEEPHAPLFSRMAGGTVPALVHGGKRFSDSTDILVHADEFRGGDFLYPRDVALRKEVDALEEKFDTELGPHTRRWAYAQILPHLKQLRSLWSRDVPRLEGVAIKLIAPLTRPLVRKAYKITTEGAQRSLDRVRSLFEDVRTRLGDGHRFLAGDRFTAADLTFAALAAPMLLPPGCRAVQPTIEDIPAAMRDEVLRLRDTDAGRFALRLFAQERG
jgi:glutathione S-transferase